MDKKTLISEIERHNRAYWQDNSPAITDQQYDSLVEELVATDQDHPLVTKLPVVNSDRGKYTHTVPMLSLAKAYFVEDLLVWAEVVARDPREQFILSSKKDGLSSEFWEGLLVTRGNGDVGFDISDRIPYVKGLARGRGEILVTKEDFKKAPLRSGGEAYKTPRSAAAGMVNDLGPVQKGVLTFVPFTSDGIDLSLAELRTLDWGKVINKFLSGPYPLDGLVLSLQDTTYGDSLGVTSHHPRGSMALKFKNPSAQTVVQDIRWTVGKRKLTPTAILEPVEISGFMNAKASLHNLDELLAKGVAVGDTVLLERCGDIIPQIVRVISSVGDPQSSIPSNCPACGSCLERVTPNLICPNRACGGTRAKLLLDSVKRLGIDGVGPGIAKDLCEQGITDIYGFLAEGDFSRFPCLGPKTAKTIQGEVLRVKTAGVYDYQILAAANIPGVGLGMAKTITNHKSLQDLLSGHTDMMACIPGVGDVIADAFYNRMPLVASFLSILRVRDREPESAEATTVVFTGKNSQPRKFWVQHAKNKGYSPVRSVTKELGLLVCEDINSTSSKARKAGEYGAKIMTYEEFADG